MTSSDERAGLALLSSWKNSEQLIQLHVVTNPDAVTFRSAGNVVGLLADSLHFVGRNCEVFLGFDGASFEVESPLGKSLKLLLVGGEQVFISEAEREVTPL